MTAQIIHLTTQIQHWLNQRVARHLAAQAEQRGPLGPLSRRSAETLNQHQIAGFLIDLRVEE